MRSARLIPDRLAVVLVAHGSRDPRAAASTTALARAVRRAHPTWDVHASYLDHAGPRPLDVLATLPGRRAVVVPLLLTEAYHGRVDVPAVISDAAALPVDVTLAEVLGPSPSGPTGVVPDVLLDGLVRRLQAAEPEQSELNVAGPNLAGPSVPGPSVARPSVAGPSVAGPSVAGPNLAGTDRIGSDRAGLDAVVLAAAGTRDAAARETILWTADALSARLGVSCIPAFASAAQPDPGTAVSLLRASGARRVAMATYFLAPGFLYDLAVRSAREAGAVAIADPLGDAPELVRLVASRVLAATGRALSAAA